ncbi:MAG: sulfite exporter TauE/SafE family protein, partial [Bacteroidales bacterium]
RKTLSITLLCGVGHVAGSIILGMIGIAAGILLTSLEFIEGVRGEIATWVLITFGLVYMAWGIRKALRNKPHTHTHTHADGTVHQHHHDHHDEHTHAHTSLTPWILFTIFILGPCEPLIPLLMYPAALHSAYGIWMVSLVFGVATIMTMMVVVGVVYAGIKPLKFSFAEKYMHAIAGFTILVCGLAMQFLGL